MKFRMVDRILEWEPKSRIAGIKTVSFEEYSLKDAFGDVERLPETLLLESLFQLGNWLVILSSDFTRMGLVIRIQQAVFDSHLLPGERMVLEVQVRSYRDDGITFDGSAHAGARRIAHGNGCLALPAPLSEYCDPDELKILYSEIHRPEEGAP